MARVLSGEALEIQEAEGVGGYAGDVIYLPRANHLAANPTENARVYLSRVACSVTSRRLEFAPPAGMGLPPDFRAFCTLIAAPPIRQALEDAMPASEDLRQEFTSLSLGGRSSPVHTETMEGRLEAFRQELLGRHPEVPEPLSGLLRRIAAASESWDDTALQELWRQFRHGVRRTARRQRLSPL